MTTDAKFAVIGLDCADPALVFERWLDELPNIKSVVERGTWGPLESTIPAITVPAWMCMMTSQDPGQLGFYGFRNRRDHSYDGLFFANSQAVRVDAAWDVLGRAGKQVIVVGVPPSYPPKAVNGNLISCFLTPDADSEFTYPASLKGEIIKELGEYIIDVGDFRTDDKDYLLEQVWKMTANRFAAARWLATHKPWDFMMFVEMGPDRLHHGMWKYFDPTHPNYEDDPRYKDKLKEYYVYLDGKVGEFLEVLPADAHVMLVSDHGIKSMLGGICFNDWLIREGYLTLKEAPAGKTKFKYDLVDWEKTRAWGDGGYYGRCFLNVAGREPRGVIPAGDYEKVRTELVEKLEAITDERGVNIGTRAFRPEDIYRSVGNVPPDLVVYFGNLDWRSIGSVGNPTIHVHENDTGPDDANHAQFGICAYAGPGVPAGRRDDLMIYDVAPTVLKALGVDAPPAMIGKDIS
jgi:predicted AlkP superfamily phosphohydrolase/phosphomutase